jgi:hypothetical protein
MNLARQRQNGHVGVDLAEHHPVAHELAAAAHTAAEWAETGHLEDV